MLNFDLDGVFFLMIFEEPQMID